MSRLWLIALREYKRRVLSKGFILVVLSVPLLAVAIIGMVALTEYLRYNGKPVGYVDHAGLLASPVAAPVEGSSVRGLFSPKPVRLVPYLSEETAREDLDAGSIQAYYVLATDYMKTRRVDVVYGKAPGENATQQFEGFLKINLAADQPSESARRAAVGTFLTVRTPDDSREYQERALFGPLLILVILLAIMIWFLSNSGALVGALVEEKENRTIEMLVTSVSPGRLIGGKVVGIVGVALTQLLGWAALALLMRIAGTQLGLPWLQSPGMPARNLVILAMVAIPSFALFAATMTGLGSAVADAQESQQITALALLSFEVPLFMLQTLVENPHGTQSVALTLFPPTALPSLVIRMAFASVPMWQIASSAAITSICALVAAWLAGRAFRLGMLRYGRRVRWGELRGGARRRLLRGGDHE